MSKVAKEFKLIHDTIVVSYHVLPALIHDETGVSNQQVGEIPPHMESFSLQPDENPFTVAVQKARELTFQDLKPTTFERLFGNDAADTNFRVSSLLIERYVVAAYDGIIMESKSTRLPRCYFGILVSPAHPEYHAVDLSRGERIRLEPGERIYDFKSGKLSFSTPES